MTSNNMPCGCAAAVDVETYTVCAGQACNTVDTEDTLGCGSLEALTPLPNVHILEQSYVYGFTPEEALSRGTMFPELVN